MLKHNLRVLANFSTADTAVAHGPHPDPLPEGEGDQVCLEPVGDFG